MRERLEQETGKRTSSEGDHGENLSKVGFICQDKNVFEMLLISEAVEEAEKAGDESAYKDNRGRGENLNHKDFQLLWPLFHWFLLARFDCATVKDVATPAP